MPVQLPADAFKITTQEIRMFLRDQPKYNILLDDIEFDDEDIRLAIKLTVAKWNSITPISNLTSAEYMNEWVLLCGVCCILFNSEGARQLRNQLQTQDGNIAPVGLDEKEGLYRQWADRFCAEFEDKSQRAKIQANMESLLTNQSCLRSGYAYIGRWTV